MKKYKLQSLITFIIFVGVITMYSCSNNLNDPISNFTNYSGPYLGQTLPGDEPEIFASGMISTAMYTRDITMTPNGNEIYFCVSAMDYNLIFYTKQINGAWTEPALAPFIKDFDKMYYEPHITMDGKQLLFLSDMPVNDNESPTQDIWAVDRNGDTWGVPYNLGIPINTDGNEFFPSTTTDGTLYFTRAEKGSRIHYIYRSKIIDGKYQEPERLNDNVNCGSNRFNAFIDPDERFIIVSVIGMEDGLGGTDYYIVFRDGQDNWSNPVNLGEQVNQVRGAEWSPYVSPDGKYFFFMSDRTDKLDISSGELPTYRKLRDKYKKPGNGNSSIYWMKSDFLFESQKKITDFELE